VGGEKDVQKEKKGKVVPRGFEGPPEGEKKASGTDCEIVKKQRGRGCKHWHKTSRGEKDSSKEGHCETAIRQKKTSIGKSPKPEVGSFLEKKKVVPKNRWENREHTQKLEQS